MDDVSQASWIPRAHMPASCQVGSGDQLIPRYTTQPSANILIFKIWWATSSGYGTIQARISFGHATLKLPPLPGPWLVDQNLCILRQIGDRIDLRFGGWMYCGTPMACFFFIALRCISARLSFWFIEQFPHIWIKTAVWVDQLWWFYTALICVQSY